jgi:hypothetical protein
MLVLALAASLAVSLAGLAASQAASLAGLAACFALRASPDRWAMMGPRCIEGCELLINTGWRVLVVGGVGPGPLAFFSVCMYAPLTDFVKPGGMLLSQAGGRRLEIDPPLTAAAGANCQVQVESDFDKGRRGSHGGSCMAGGGRAHAGRGNSASAVRHTCQSRC